MKWAWASAGAPVAFSVIVTDGTPQSLFFLVRTREQPVVMAPNRPVLPPSG